MPESLTSAIICYIKNPVTIVIRVIYDCLPAILQIVSAQGYRFKLPILKTTFPCTWAITNVHHQPAIPVYLHDNGFHQNICP